ncbi:DUF5057 domain-containing protein [Simiaoa sunii]|jgi:hypothetical protein|uniref:DUF5057 domain-containing protein n=1 Tax=Simiaoa sunii TaxID=2763672 RepID=A0A7G9FRR0_9FIRM|nr:DUF5057 domain-containing protein [Simiaoa sunii]QNM01242.1 DUF5057 domain-containing protein [Simiaoa sunii]
MKKNLKHNTKKYIAGILTIALAAGVCQSYGSMEVSAQEMTLPGIEKLVQDTVASSDGTFHILEIVPSKKDASIGYLIGGEEPVSEGRKLSELPASSERLAAMATIDSNSLGDLAGSNGPVNFSAYREGGSRTEEIRGSFVKNTENNGQYTYTQTESVYTLYAEGDTRQRFDRYGAIETSGTSNKNKQSVSPVFSKVSGISGQNLEMTIGDTAKTALAATRYALTPYDKNSDGSMNDINNAAFNAGDYVNREVYTKTADDVYTYLGKVVYGGDLPAGYAIQSTAITSENPSEASENLGEVTTAESSGLVTAASASGNDAAAESGNEMQTFSVQSTSGNDIVTSEQKNLYILNMANTTPILWAAWNENPGGTGSYTLKTPADGYFVHFTENNTSGEYYVSKVTLSNTNGDYKLIDSYKENDTGKYVMVSSGTMQVSTRLDSGYEASNSYDFIGDNAKDALVTVAYDGGFYNKEWFKKQVLNLSGSSRYEKDADYSGEVNDFNIEVTTLTLAQLAELTATDSQAYYGINLDDVDLIYLSGRGSYAAESVNMTSAATALTKMIFGIKDTTGERNNADRVPVVMDYGFYSQNKTLAKEPNNNQNNKILTQMALTILKVSDDNIAKEVASQGDAYWNGQTATSLSLDDSVKEALYDNVYLNDDSATPYVASDFLADWKGNAAKAATFEAVLKEIQYENFLAKKNNNAAQMDEKISKASITRYILNWYMHRVTVKSSIRVLDLEPCYDFKSATTLTADRVKEFMGRKDTYTGSVEIKQMSSAEFIGKVEDLNEKYDMIYLGARVGKMNTENGVTVYNDPQMKGLIYSHVGDYYDYATKTDTENVTQARETYNARHRLQDSSLDHRKTDDDDPTNKSADVYRGPGNDMNSTRYEEFCQFIEAGYPVVIADTFIKVDNNNIPVASTATLDKNSYFYKLVDFALQKDANGQYLYWQKNIFTESQLTDNTADTKLGTTLSARRSVFCNYLNLSKLSVNWVTTYGAAYPQELKYNSNQNGASNGGSLEKIDGKYQLQYIFNLQNDAAISQTGTTYDCKLFVDKNADGRFSGSDYVEGKTYTSSEEVSGLTVYIRKGDEWIKVDPIATENGNRYELRTGEIYRVIRVLPEEYVGVIPWKLVFYDNTDRLVRTAKSGYTSVPQQNGKKTIRVLQLLSDDNRNNWNLHDEQNNSNSTFSKCINGLTDWNVVGLDQVGADGKVNPSKSIDSMTVTYLINDKLKISGTSDTDIQKIYQESYNLFQQYDMLILGFGDAYRFGYTYGAYDPSKEIPAGIMENVKRNLAVGWAVRDYIESGKSILFTHDTTSYVNNIQSVIPYNDNGTAEIYHSNYWYWGYEFNKTIRASVGLDRYGALKEYYQQRAASTTGEEQKRDQEYLKTLESYTFDEIKEPNSDNELWQKEGVTKYTVVRFLRSYLEDLRTTNSSEVWFPVKNSLLKQAGYDNGNGPAWNYPSNLLMGDYAGSSLIATQVNDGQITQYPYQISADEQLEISNTHYQWLQPNMELDRNGDGKNDIVVWYCISGVADGNYKNTNIYNITPNDVVNNYYIYTMGNVTYSGAGHSTPSKESEIKLFVNTMIAAYNAGVTAPSVRFKDKSGSKIQSVYMLYDSVNHIVLDDKNNGTISVNFQADDYNILAGGQQLCVEFYKSCADDTSGAISVDGITGKVLRLKTDGEDGLKITDSNGNVISPIERNGVKNCYPITNGATYTLKYSSDEMGLFSTDTSGTILNEGAQASTIYARVYTVYDSGSKVTPCGIAELSISAQELFELD